MKQLLVILLLLFANVRSQESFKGNFKKHLTFKDTFFGNEDDYQVCYPKEHRMFFIGIFAASAAAISMFVVILYIKSKHNKTLKGINKEISEKNKEILDSITYAKRIQESIMPTEQQLKAISGLTRILYQPRDIVSGDLFWAHKNSNGVYLAAIDCTGHGVPGAFLSLLAHNAIEQAVIEKKINSPAMILDSMNSFIKGVLNQNNSEEITDGMEVGLCLISGEKVTYAGANIKLKYSAKGEIHEIKATKCSVGTVQRNITGPPEEHVLTLQKGDRIYMHTDGIVDQFGETNTKKFTSKSVNQLLRETSSLNLQEQIARVKSSFERWKGATDQTDDVLLIIHEI